MEPIYHTGLSIPILSLINGIILIIGFYYFGQLIQKKFSIDKIIGEISYINYQNILVSTVFTVIFLYPICLFIENSSNILKLYSYGIYFFGFLKIILNFHKLKFKTINTSIFKLNINYLLSIGIIFGLALLSFAPITNADSLDYHLFTAKYLIEHGKFPTYLTNFHSSYVSGPGEILIALGLIVGSEQFGSILQFSGLIILIGILKKFKAPHIYYLLLFSSPVIIFFVSSIKPQLFTIYASSFAFGLIFFSNIQKKGHTKGYILKKTIIIFSILFSSILIKFSFLLSSFLLSVLYLAYLFKHKRLTQVLPIILILYFLIVLPTIFWKFNNFDGNFFELFYSPFSTERYGLKNFKGYLTALSEINFHWFVFPTSLGNFTHSLGLGTLSILYLFLVKKNIKSIQLICILFLFLFISYNFGQFTARFFLEPYTWIILFLIRYNDQIKINKIYEFFLRVQSLIFLGIVLFGVSSLSIGVINSELRDKVLEENAMGYTFFKWVNYKLKDSKSPIITFERSISFSKNFPISRDHLFYVNMSKPEAKDYLKEIKLINPKFLVFSSNNTTYKKYINCTTKIHSYGKEIALQAVRNPLNQNKTKYDIYIYTIDTNLMPECINPNKVDDYSRQ